LIKKQKKCIKKEYDKMNKKIIKLTFVKTPVILLLTFCFVILVYQPAHSGVPKYSNGNYEMKLTVFTIAGGTRTVTTTKEYYTFGESPYTTILTSGNNSARIGFLCFAIPPTAVTNLTALTSRWGRCVELTWSSPWGDTPNRNIYNGAYRIRYSTYVTSGNFWDSGSWNDFYYKNELVWSTNTLPSRSEFRRLTNLVPSVTYYIRLWTRDEEGYNWSEISNGATNWAQVVVLSVTMVPPATYYFGDLSYLQQEISTNAIVIENSGNVYQDYGLKIDTQAMVSYGTLWTIDYSSTPGNNKPVLEGIFYQNLKPRNTDFSTGVGSAEDVITPSIKWSSDIVFCSSSTVQSSKGWQVIPFENSVDDRRLLWFKITMPLATSTTQQQVIPIQINAKESDGVGPPP
jgi:hypothetical protein